MDSDTFPFHVLHSVMALTEEEPIHELVYPTQPLDFYGSYMQGESHIPCSQIVQQILCHNDQQASVFLQIKLRNSVPAVQQDILVHIVASARGLCANRYGNFLVQRVLEFGNHGVFCGIVNALRGNFELLSLDPFANHVVQTIVENCDQQTRMCIVLELIPTVEITMTDKNASHVWLKILDKCSPHEISYILPQIDRHCDWVMIAKQDAGCRIIQCLINNVPWGNILISIFDNVTDLIADRWGNWVVSHAFSIPINAGRLLQKQQEALESILHNYYSLSFNVFAAKVLQKLFHDRGCTLVQRYVDALCFSTHTINNPQYRIPLVDIVLHPTGSALVYHMIHYCNQRQREQLRTHLCRYKHLFRGSKNAQKCLELIAHLETKMQSCKVPICVPLYPITNT